MRAGMRFSHALLHKLFRLVRQIQEHGGRSIRITFLPILVALAVLCTPVFGQTTAIFDNWNKGSVDNNPTGSTSFTISEPQMITYIDTYHWNYGQGTSSGGTISLKKEDGETFGPWTVKAESGSGAANAWWISHPDVVIPAGTYTIIDSEPETWSKNSESNDCGFSKVEGHPEKAADVTPDSGKETEAALTSDVAMGNKENPIISPLTPTQKDFLKAVQEDLRKIGNEKTAENLEKYIASGHVTFGEDTRNPDTFASVTCPALGYLDPFSSNNLIINPNLGNWDMVKKRADKYNEKGDYDKEERALHEMRKTIRDLTYTLIHEDVHMNQFWPDEVPKDEDPAYERQISEMRRVITEDMQKIREIQGLGAQLPGDQDKLNELIEDLNISIVSYQESINSMQGANDVIKTGKVTPETFKTSQADMDELVKEAGDLIKSVGQNADPTEALGWYNKGMDLLYKEKNPGEAIKAFDKAIKLNQLYAMAWFYKGVALEKNGEFVDSDNAFKEAIRIDPRYEEDYQYIHTVGANY